MPKTWYHVTLLNEIFPMMYNMLGFETKNVHPQVDALSTYTIGCDSESASKIHQVASGITFIISYQGLYCNFNQQPVIVLIVPWFSILSS